MAAELKLTSPVEVYNEKQLKSGMEGETWCIEDGNNQNCK